MTGVLKGKCHWTDLWKCIVGWCYWHIGWYQYAQCQPAVEYEQVLDTGSLACLAKSLLDICPVDIYNSCLTLYSSWMLKCQNQYKFGASSQIWAGSRQWWCCCAAVEHWPPWPGVYWTLPASDLRLAPLKQLLQPNQKTKKGKRQKWTFRKKE